MIRLQILRQASDFDKVRSLWKSLSALGNRSLFQRFAWNRLAAELFADREEPHVIVAESNTSAAILPLCIRRDGTAALLGETLFDYRDMLSSGDPEIETALFREAANLGLPLDIIAVHRSAADRWGFVGLKPFTNAPLVQRDVVTPDRLMEDHRRLGRHSRRIRREGVELRQRTGEDTSFVRALYQLKSQQEGSLFVDPVRRDFMERICAEEGQRCQIFTYERGEHIVAANLTFTSGATRHFYTVYYDPQWSEFSPGQVLLYEATLESLSRNLDCDFMTGEYPYKMRLANTVVPLYKVSVSADELRAAVAERSAQIAA